MSCFAGPLRKEDIEHWTHMMAAFHGILVLMISIDLAYDSAWDLSMPTTYHALALLCAQGLIDEIFGGPPCSTVSRVRWLYLPGGPRPVRSRDYPWGLPGLTSFEQNRVKEANSLWINFWSLCELDSARGGAAHGCEHPSDPGLQPFPSIFIADELIYMEQRTNAVRATFHQCPFGGLTSKLTTVSGTLDGLLEMDGVRCPESSESHVHAPSSGLKSNGEFHSRIL